MRIWVLCFAVTLFASIGDARAGTTGGLTGYVCDIDTGKPVAGAVVTAISNAQTSKTITDAAGYYVFISLVPATYTLSVEKAGYEPTSISGISVLPDVQMAVNVREYPMRLFLIVDRFEHNWLLEPGVTVDRYHVNRSTFPGYGFTTMFSDQLRFVPGMQMGSASKMIQ